MATATDGAWKLIIIPFALIFIVFIIMNLVVTPFVDEGVPIDKNENTAIDILNNLALYGVPFNITLTVGSIFGFDFDINLGNVLNFPYLLVPTSIKQFLSDQITALVYLPNLIQIPIIILIYISLILAFYVLMTYLIP